MTKKFCSFLLFFYTLIQFNPSLAQSSKRPNIIFILADDLGYGDVGFNGQKLIRTPNIDRLAAEGVQFTQFYAGTSVCAPSRSSLMSGKHTGHTYIRGNKGVDPEGQEPIADSVVTIAEILKKAGYTTGAFGKWGLGPVGSYAIPISRVLISFMATIVKVWRTVITLIICGKIRKKLFWKLIRIYFIIRNMHRI